MGGQKQGLDHKGPLDLILEAVLEKLLSKDFEQGNGMIRLAL